MVYGTDAMIPAEISPPSWRRETLTLEENSEALGENLYLVQELRDKAHFREFVSKQRPARRYNTREHIFTGDKDSIKKLVEYP
jgi:hypothetical protein